MDEATARRIESNPAFVELVNTRRSFAWTLTIVMLVIYFGYIFLVAFAPGFIGAPLAGTITWGLVLGIAVILSAIILTGIYVARANSTYDELTRSVVAALGVKGAR